MRLRGPSGPARAARPQSALPSRLSVLPDSVFCSALTFLPAADVHSVASTNQSTQVTYLYGLGLQCHCMLLLKLCGMQAVEAIPAVAIMHAWCWSCGLQARVHAVGVWSHLLARDFRRRPSTLPHNGARLAGATTAEPAGDARDAYRALLAGR
jgi:hypothetical protein